MTETISSKRKTLTGDARKRNGYFCRLTDHPHLSWNGWVIFSWEMGYRCYLFSVKPEVLLVDGEPDSFDFTGAIEGVSPYFLKACGIKTLWDKQGAAGKEFYYGDGCLNGSHPPIPIRLYMPEVLLDQLNLTQRIK